MNTSLIQLPLLGVSLIASLALADDPKPPMTVTGLPAHVRGHHHIDLKPFLGVVTAEAPEALRSQLNLADGEGLVVEAVVPDSPAEKAGVQRFDILHLFNDQIVSNPEQLLMLVHRAGKGTSVTLTVLRKGHEEKLTAVLAEKDVSMEFRGGFPQGSYAGRTVITDNGQELRDRIQSQVADAMGKKGDLGKRLEELQKQIQALGVESKGKLQEAIQGIEKEVEKNLSSIPGVDVKVDVSSEAKSTSSSAGATTGKGLSLTVTPGMSVFYTSGLSADGGNATTSSSLSDSSGSYTVTTKDGKRTLSAKDPSGKITFEGPINTEDERKILSADLRAKLREIEKRNQTIKVETAPKSTPDQPKEREKKDPNPL